jgi:hypothetical protein
MKNDNVFKAYNDRTTNCFKVVYTQAEKNYFQNNISERNEEYIRERRRVSTSRETGIK